MKPVVLLVGKLRDVVNSVSQDLSYMPVEWLGAHSIDDVNEQLDNEPRVASVIIGGTLDDRTRTQIVTSILSKRSDLCIYIKDRDSGPEAFQSFARSIVEATILQTTEPA